MATMNPFDLLGDDDNDDVSQLVEKIAAAPPKKAPAAAAGKAAAPPAKLPSKPVPPAQAVREARNEGGRGGRGGRGYGRGGRGGRGYDRDSANNEGSFGNRAISGGQGGTEESNGRSFERRGGYGGPRGGFRGGRQGSFGNGDAEDGERPRRTFDRRSGTGHGNEFKREGAGRGNWGAQADEINHEIQEAVVEGEKTVAADKPTEEEASDVKNENPAPETVEEPEVKEMTLEEYQIVLEEKRKALAALKTEERKVEVDKDLASMQQLSNKKTNDDIFVKLGSDKDKRKEIADKEERTKKSLSINEFLKPAEGERQYTGGRGRGRGGSRGGGRFNQGGGGSSYAPEAPKIEDPSHFPTLGGK
ncbi:putative hyaluronan/mRNA-binding protein [Helianthus annuus]|uniref:Hyaluronan/mRNA-binding protein n=1 Tax=Helianthus annuus TaxID=4232 RepID=A0A251T0M8_HELAN|nr:RGG repeats nuclear RNA binding protein A [Helianthus annuus]KAF5775614.1 putative hyaluronan/mRNA-binding protein [Helianthus annuus]KAJ0478708.1 putative hyaluronan/mRNA-binding protein [Helianthus annuus]KAJ0499590.1 putative hyaluronan/mRNA-binding protein [Helianthus annuus]KAJ0665602.1 putative hyaluronan/mRNA-binding protein [Helianthus annuus]